MFADCTSLFFFCRDIVHMYRIAEACNTWIISVIIAYKIYLLNCDELLWCIRDAFGKYAQLCFELFGDRVKHWITFNEIHSFAGAGYYDGTFAPGRCSSPYGNCHFGDSLTEPYIVAHHALNSHALAVDIYRKKFQVWFLVTVFYIKQAIM